MAATLWSLIAVPLLALIWFLFVQSPPQGFDRHFSQIVTFPPPGYLNTTKGSFIPLEKYFVQKFAPVFGGETVFFSSTGDLYTGTIDGYLLKLNHEGPEGILKLAHLPGSILGGAFALDDKG
jgi:hypothetical protein